MREQSICKDASKIKKRFPRLPICIVADGLYVSEKVLKICKANSWDYIIRYKEGCAPCIEQEYKAIPEKNKAGNAEYVNGVIFKDFDVNVLKYRETKKKRGESVTTEFAWITNIEITDKNAQKLVRAGRSRWKIENQGFNRQKRWQGNIEHACSWNERAQKNLGDDVWPAVLIEAGSNGDANTRTVVLDDATMVVKDIEAESLSAGSGTRAPAGGLNAAVTVTDSQDRPMSAGFASDDGKYYSVTITAKDAQGIDIDAANGVITVTYDSEKLELVDIAVNGDYQSIRDVRGEVTFGYVDLTGIAAGDTAADLTFNVIDDSANEIIIDHKEVNDVTSGYRERLSVGSEHETDESESTETETETETETAESETIESESSESKITESETAESESSVKPGNDKETKPSADNNKNNKTDSPKTGDNTPITFLIILLVISGFGVAAAILYKRKLR